MTGNTRITGDAQRGGFTLVELLIAVTLVVLMMAMFAEIFGLAAGAVSTQKGAANNDQKVRTFTTLLRNDVKARTFRTIVPFRPVPVAQQGAFNTALSLIAADRLGYFSISENDPDDPTDDVLSFTVDVNHPVFGTSGAILYGKADQLTGPPGPPGPVDPYAADQPEFDDGIQGDGRGASTLAEVSYFLRNGNLYRSVMLIREPYYSPPLGSDQDQPTANDALTPLLDTSVTPQPKFWGRFDYSAFRDPNTNNIVVHGATSLSNALPTGGGPSLSVDIQPGVTVPASLGIPHIRWGHKLSGAGEPIEYVTFGATQQYIGRFLKQEMSDADFLYPGDPPSPNPGVSPEIGATWNPSKGLVTPYDDETGNPRRGEELLISNVHEFDIQVWDNGSTTMAPGYVNLGHGTAGWFFTGTSNPGYGNRFDTWHPGLPDPTVNADPAFLTPFPMTIPGVDSADGAPGVATIDDDGINGIDDAGEEGWIGSDDERPLRAMKIRVRFYDRNSGRMRQLTETFPLIDAKT